MKTILIINQSEVETKVIDYLHRNLNESINRFKMNGNKKQFVEDVISTFANPHLANNDYDEYFSEFMAESEGFDIILDETDDVNYHVKNLPSLAKIYNSEKD